MTETFQVIIIGSGFGGQSAAVNLINEGIDDFVILERRTFIGGTWKQNRYPGAAVDVQSPLYSLSFAPYDWSCMFAQQDELARYTDDVYQRYGLHQKTSTNSTVTQVSWLADEQQWRVEINHGERVLHGRFVINASGPLSTPVTPDFAGLSSYQGKTFHTNDWDNDYDHRGKRVAIIGSGASAAQVIPAIAPEVEHLHVFQRTPHWVMPRKDMAFRPWQRRWLRKPWVYKGLRGALYMALELRILGFKYSKRVLKWLAERPARALLAKQVGDPQLRASLTPDYTIGCKRILLSNTLYPALCRDNVTLHDKSDGVAHFTPQGIVTAQGQTLALDLVVFATGYDATDGVISYPVIGQQGVTLSSVWQDFPRAYQGTSVPGFPNFFLVTGPNTGIGHTSAIFMIESQMFYIMNCIRHVRDKAARSIAVTAQAEANYTENIHQEMARTVWHNGGCHSWYQSQSGKVIAMFPGFSFTFRRLCRRFKPQHHEVT
ncbi:NAD(P)/FAD-dependent oxidoreductase [Aestuariibacter halophilus]|uniref:NAD(P)/FAD-dependent oxidoreductase n=1 Tax=Fluctibacter halophilus TaxID=226011 RepID=A0ABS8G7V4_9ALTE|nr:NAD(P)/FAD-dependent oxidoreductase [Aestuariibacter halophilus]MCC2616603.1 NAD(P)/FAD-dependent oxidoreductase [Aestuariibacter halophilus]